MPPHAVLSLRSTVGAVLERVTIEGFKSFDSTTVDVGRITLLVGPNGAGKTNFIRVFELLGEMTRSELQLSVGRAGGASTLLHQGPRRAAQIRVEMSFGRNTYGAELVPTADDTLIFGSEWVTFQGDFASDITRRLGVGHKESNLESSEEKIASWAHGVIGRWVVYHFHDTGRLSPVKQKGDIGDNASLRHDAANLAAFLFRLRETNEPSYLRIVDSVRLVAPFFDDFRLRPDPLNTDKIQLEWAQRDSDGYFGPDALSDGTLRYICIATLLLQPDPPSLILLDEPELGLHPYAIDQVAAMFRSSTKQLVVSTQSVTLLNHMNIEDVLIAEQAEGASTLTRPSLETLDVWLQEYGLGEMWEKNLIGGRPIQR